ncbi:unnamed protein product [Penicillium salamii]|nr:unnamed protein product [Penicillium salamii]
MRTANSFGFDKSIGLPYKAAVQSCLDAELFRDGPIDPARFEKDLEIRREVLYEKVVLPLRGLYHAYKDDWEIQDSPKPTISPSPATNHKERSRRDKAPERRKFTVAIFCALETEADAVTEAFDEIWNEKCESYENAGPDNNRYTRGRILEHNVVLVHMIGPGKRCASEAAAGLRCTYPEIKLILVVGICGGVPSRSERKGELILGDIVISEKVVQYDLGRQFSDGFATKSGLEASSRPGPRILGILSKMKVTRERERIEKQISQHLRTIQSRIGHQKAGYPGTDKDELFKSTYRHKHHHPPSWDVCSASTTERDPVCEAARTSSCQELGCQKEMLISRKRLEIASATGEPPKPKLHFGSVGSGDTVMKSGEHRDRMAAQHELIAFEMEASGIPSNLQCIVIKAVCDYADSHKNKYWQDYAAAAAAAGLICALEEFTFYNKLPALPIAFLRDEWKGGSFDTGHPGHNQLLTMNWAGKTFHSTESVDPIVMLEDGKRVCNEEWGHAVLREVRFRDLVSTAMIYDKHPIIDHFRYVNDKLIAGAMDTTAFGEAGTYYFYLYR